MSTLPQARSILLLFAAAAIGCSGVAQIDSATSSSSSGQGGTSSTSQTVTSGTGGAPNPTAVGGATPTGECTPPTQTADAVLLCTFAIDCSADFGACGSVESPFDEQGCLRAHCFTDGECSDSEKCYRAEEFGGCYSSGPEYVDVDGECQLLGADADCGGAYCVPAELYPALEDA